MTPQWPGQGAARLHRVTVMIFIGIAATLQHLPGHLAAQARTAVQIDVDSATAHSVSSDGDRSVLCNICDFFTGCFEADRVTLFHFRNSTARGTLRGLTSDALL